jgi:hypothetical protein
MRPHNFRRRAVQDKRAAAMTRRRWMWLTAVAAALLLGVGGWLLIRFPPDTEPQGAYMRIARAISRGQPRACFAYLEDQAQHAAYTVRDYRRRARDRVEEAYPEPERTRLLQAYRADADAEDGADVFLRLANERGWVTRLRRDLSGVAKVEIAGERATIETARGTRYPFRRRDNGIWGLTLFTAELLAESERAARDFEVVDRAAADYERARK